MRIATGASLQPVQSSQKGKAVDGISKHHYQAHGYMSQATWEWLAMRPIGQRHHLSEF
jgi:hypothetical protein